MKKITKNGWIELGVSLAIFAVLATIAGLFDLKINIALYNPNSLFGLYFANLGELPTYIAAPVAGTILFYQNFGRNKKELILWKVLFGIVVFVGYFAAIWMWFWDNFVDESIKYAIVYQLVFSAFLTALTLFSCAYVPEEKMKKLFWFAVFLAVIAAMSNLIVQIMKSLWARQRFRTMTEGHPKAPEDLGALGCANYEGFTNWWQINVFSKPEIRTDAYVEAFKHNDSGAFKSFPSGHTVAAATSFGLIILPDMFSRLNNKKIKWVFWVAPIVYTTLVAISRIVVAAHYLSDVTFGGFIGFGVAALTRWIFVSKIKNLSDDSQVSEAIATEEVIAE